MLAVGLLALLLVWQIPGLRWLEFFVVMFIAAGAIIRTRLGQNSRHADPITAPIL